jgi:ribonuclease T2
MGLSAIFRTVLAAVILVATSLSARAESPGNFDFYVLSLSWSPTWCADNDPGGRTRQCDGSRRYGFVVHGLWPQNERSWPEFCDSREPDRVPETLVRPHFDIIPSMGLAGHEWRKHGTCSGLGQAGYFRLIRQAYDGIRLPPLLFKGDIARNVAVKDIETQFIRSNPGLTPEAIAVGCDGGKLSEIRICMTRSLKFRDCDEVDRKGCRMRTVSIPSIP